MNRPLIKRTQASILDPAKPFDMTRWDTCIAGHCLMVLKQEGKLEESELEEMGPMAYVSRAMGIPLQEGRLLFGMTFGATGKDRQVAAKHLQSMLRRKPAQEKVEEPKSKESSLRGKARSRSPRATLQAPVPAPADLEAIDALLREAEEEPVLV